MSSVAELEVPDSLWEQLRARPGRTPELIALAAAERFARPAENWVRVAGPGKQPPALALSAMRKHVRLAQLEGATLGAGGVMTSAADLGALAFIQARMVFYIAASYGHDPRDPMRPAELLALWEIYPSAAEAREALDGVGRPLAQAVIQSQLMRDRNSAVTAKLLRFVGRRVARRTAGRFLPLVSGPIAMVQNGGVTRQLGRRALAYYGAKNAP